MARKARMDLLLDHDARQSLLALGCPSMPRTLATSFSLMPYMQSSPVSGSAESCLTLGSKFAVEDFQMAAAV